MNTDSAIIGAILVVICALPFILMYSGKVKKQKKMLRSLKTVANEHACQIAQHEFCGDLVIGLDTSKNYLFLFKKLNDQERTQYVDLSGIQTCYPNKVTRILKQNNKKSDIIDRVELCFVPNSKSQKESVFELYNEQDDVQLRGEVLLINKWSDIVNTRLKAS